MAYSGVIQPASGGVNDPRFCREAEEDGVEHGGGQRRIFSVLQKPTGDTAQALSILHWGGN